MDQFTLSTLLLAAGVDLEATSFEGSGHTSRFEGLTMVMAIEYQNSWAWKGMLPPLDHVYLYDHTTMHYSVFVVTVTESSSTAAAASRHLWQVSEQWHINTY